MKSIFLLALAICLLVTANAQKNKIAPAKNETKTFVVSEETKKDLPEGVIFANNKLTLKSGYKFEQLPNNAGVKVINEKNSQKPISGTFTCYCSGGAGTACKLTTMSSTVFCEGGVCCTITTTINSSIMSNVEMKQN
jgi:hypothetical protein